MKHSAVSIQSLNSLHKITAVAFSYWLLAFGQKKTNGNSTATAKNWQNQNQNQQLQRQKQQQQQQKQQPFAMIHGQPHGTLHGSPGQAGQVNADRDESLFLAPKGIERSRGR